MRLTRTTAGHLLIWERGTKRYTLGYRFGHFRRRFSMGSHPLIYGKRFGVHLVRWPMTEVEKRTRGLV